MLVTQADHDAAHPGKRCKNCPVEVLHRQKWEDRYWEQTNRIWMREPAMSIIWILGMVGFALIVVAIMLSTGVLK